MSGIRTNVNGDRVIHFSNTKQFKKSGLLDVQSLSAWYDNDPAKNHLGLVNLSSSISKEEFPLLMNFFTKGAILKVNGMGDRFTYDIEIKQTSGTTTLADTSDYSTEAGIDGSYFPIVLSELFRPHVVVSYDLRYGQQVMVSEKHEVTQEEGGFRHWVRLVTEDPKESFDNNFLKAGIDYFVVGHNLGEFSEEFAGISTANAAMRTMTCEFILGNHRGVETYVTKYANSKSLGGATVNSREYWNYFVDQQSKIVGADGNINDMFIVASQTPAGISKSSMFVGLTMEYLVILETLKLEAFQLMYQRGAVMPSNNGTVRLNEGIWHQYRRGNRTTYSRAGGITRSILKKVVGKMFANSTLMPHEREVTFECGRMAYLNMMELFKDEANVQLSALAPLLGSDNKLPKGVLTGDLQSLSLDVVMFKSVIIPDIGRIKIIHEPALDYRPLADRMSRGFVGEGYAKEAYSMVIKDSADEKYSNASKGMPSNTTLVNPKTSASNVFYVMPEYGAFEWGRTQGRTSPTNANEMVLSSMKKMGTEFWAHSSSAGWVKNVDNIYIIELK